MTDIFQGLALVSDLAAAGLGFAGQFLTAQKHIDLASKYYDLYDEQRQYYYGNFQANGELPLNNQVFAVPFYTPGYTGATTASALFWFNNFRTVVNNFFPLTIVRHTNMYNAGNFISQPSFDVDFAEIQDDWYSYMFRYEEHKRDVYNARRWAQQMDSLGYGVKEGASVERGLATSFQVFDEAQGQLGSALNTLGNGLSTYSRYNKVINAFMNEPEAERKQQQSNFQNVQQQNQPSILPSLGITDWSKI